MRHASRSILPFLVAGIAVLGACGSDDGGDTTTTDAPSTSTPTTDAPTTTMTESTLPTVDVGITVGAEGFEGWQEERLDGCTQFAGRVVDPAGEWQVALQLTGTACAVEEALNGRHGSYRTDADVPATTTDPVESAIGDGVAFEQTYTECTNSCSDFTEPVVLLTLDAPPDAEHPTLTLIGLYGEASADDVAAIVASLSPA